MRSRRTPDHALRFVRSVIRTPVAFDYLAWERLVSFACQVLQTSISQCTKLIPGGAVLDEELRFIGQSLRGTPLLRTPPPPPARKFGR